VGPPQAKRSPITAVTAVSTGQTRSFSSATARWGSRGPSPMTVRSTPYFLEMIWAPGEKGRGTTNPPQSRLTDALNPSDHRRSCNFCVCLSSLACPLFGGGVGWCLVLEVGAFRASHGVPDSQLGQCVGWGSNHGCGQQLQVCVLRLFYCCSTVILRLFLCASPVRQSPSGQSFYGPLDKREEGTLLA